MFAFAVMYMKTFVRINLHLTNLHLSVSYFSFHWVQKYRGGQQHDGGEDVQLFVREIEGFCFGRISPDVYPMFGQVVSIYCTVPSKQAECNNISEKHQLKYTAEGRSRLALEKKSVERVCSLSSRNLSINRLTKHGANVRKTWSSNLWRKHLVQHIPVTGGLNEMWELIEIAKTQRNKVLFFRLALQNMFTLKC